MIIKITPVAVLSTKNEAPKCTFTHNKHMKNGEKSVSSRRMSVYVPAEMVIRRTTVAK
jgi:hypothetical protein